MEKRSSNKRKSKRRFKGYIYIGSIDPGLSIESIKDYFTAKNMKIYFQRKKLNRSKNYIVCWTTDPAIHKILTKVDKEHKVGAFVFTTDEYLKGDQKIAKDEQDARKKIYLGNLPGGTKDSELRSVFEKFGKIRIAYCKEKKTDDGKSFTYGFVTYEDEIAAQNLITKGTVLFKGESILIREFRTKWAKNKFGKDKESSPVKDDSGKKGDREELDIPKPVADLADDEVKALHEAEPSQRSKVFYQKLFDCEFSFQSESHDQKELIEFIHQKHKLERKILRLNRVWRIGNRKYRGKKMI